MEEHQFEHFNSERHTDFLKNVSITFIDKNSTTRENYWIHALKTMMFWA